MYLEQLAATGDDRALHLLDEYKHLLSASPAELAESASPVMQVQRMHVRVKEIVAPVPMYEAERRAVEQLELGVKDAHETEADAVSVPRAHQATPVAAGQTLETAALALLRRLFDLSQDQATAFPPLLRRQRGGYQFGHDLSFDAAVAGMGHVRCHVECKNYGDPIRTSDIADKLLQQKLAANTAPIDHWILISPHSDPANDLQELLRTWEETEEWEFSVQIWSPQSGVRELFSTAPNVYRVLYDADPPSVDTGEVTHEFFQRIAPRLRDPRAFRAYVRDAWRMCFAVEDAAHFTALLEDHTDIGAVDAVGRALDQKLIDVVTEWLAEPAPETMLILGEFGDGKSFFTFLLCRLLAEGFLAAPKSAIYPVRLALKDLRQVGSPDALIERWLRGIGATPAEWAELAASRRTLIVLDGFDEMTTALDPPTIQENLELLSSALETLAGPMTEANKGRKVMVTSRGRFFDQPREESALRERLGHPRLNRIRPLSRLEVLANLSRYADRIGVQDKLARIRTLYDPIGLAAKPLFLQMIKETLQDLPTDEFDATTLYETYIDRSLRRKSALLLSSQPHELAADVIGRLRKVLERVAVELHLRSTDNVDLRAVSPDGEMAALLWRMTDQADEGSGAQEIEHDARMRVAIRSLLRPIPAQSDTWQVAFFHRSVMEYFLAAAIIRMLTDGDATSVREVLDGNALSIETMDFVLQRLPDQWRDAVVDLLVTLALSAGRGGEPTNFLGGNAVSLCYLIAGRLPDADWRGLNLDGVRLVGAQGLGKVDEQFMIVWGPAGPPGLLRRAAAMLVAPAGRMMVTTAIAAAGVVSWFADEVVSLTPGVRVHAGRPWVLRAGLVTWVYDPVADAGDGLDERGVAEFAA